MSLFRSVGFRFRCRAISLRHGRPALTLAAVHAFAAVLRRLALGRSLAGIHARTVDGCGVCRHGHIRQSGREQHRGGSNHRRARQFSDLHDWFLNCYERSGIAAPLQRPGQPEDYYSIV